MMFESRPAGLNIKVVGVGGAGGNAVRRMISSGLENVECISLNTDIQALGRIKGASTFAIGLNTTRGMGSGGSPEIGRKAIKESQSQMRQLLEGSDMVFVTAGMGGGTGTGAAPILAEIARKQGALTVGVVTLPFSFEGPHRKRVAERGVQALRQKVDTLMTVDNDRLLPSLKGKTSLEKAFETADEVLRKGVQGISEIITLPGLINVDFADVKSIMTNKGASFLALGEGKGKWAAIEAARMAMANPLFDAPLEGATGILFNIKGGKDLTLGQVHEVASIIRRTSSSNANVIFGVVQDRRMKKRVSITLVATGLNGSDSDNGQRPDAEKEVVPVPSASLSEQFASVPTNGHKVLDISGTQSMF